MNITSCTNCGVVLDKDQLSFSNDIQRADGTINEDVAILQNGSWVAFVPCPVCNNEVFDD